MVIIKTFVILLMGFKLEWCTMHSSSKVMNSGRTFNFLYSHCRNWKLDSKFQKFNFLVVVGIFRTGSEDIFFKKK